MKRSPYDLRTLLERAKLWRAEAAAATLEEMRVFCLAEAVRCEARVQKSQVTPVFSEAADRPDRTARGGPLGRDASAVIPDR